MKENKDEPIRISTCFEGSPGAEMIEKIMGEGRVGALCAEIMRSMAKRPDGRREPRDDEGQAGEKEPDPDSPASPNPNKDRRTGGVK